MLGDLLNFPKFLFFKPTNTGSQCPKSWCSWGNSVPGHGGHSVNVGSFPINAILNSIEQRWEKCSPYDQVGHWQGPNCLLICQPKFWPLVLWHDKDTWDVAAACFCFKLIFSTEHWNDCALPLRRKSLPPALLSADPDLQGAFMGMVLELRPASQVYLDWFPSCPVAHGWTAAQEMLHGSGTSHDRHSFGGNIKPWPFVSSAP